MDISEIIGEGKCYVPPFKYDHYGRITDSNGNIVASVENFHRLMEHFSEHETFGVTVIVEHMCQLLNERWGK